MGGGDLNMKKSWHPLLLKNQERVWLEEQKALEEKKKLDTLRKEMEEERQLQELQRLQEEKTGRKRAEKLEWMYSTPATGSSTNPNDLEDYLLGKKRVDKILTADENSKLGASHKNFIAVQNANTARDIASKIREDPLLAIKQQQQAAYEALMSNPLCLQEMQRRNGIVPKKDKEERRREKEEKKRRKHEKKRLRHGDYSRSPSPLDRRSSSPDRYSHRRRSRSRSPIDRRRSSFPTIVTGEVVALAEMTVGRLPLVDVNLTMAECIAFQSARGANPGAEAPRDALTKIGASSAVQAGTITGMGLQLNDQDCLLRARLGHRKIALPVLRQCQPTPRQCRLSGKKD